jgi:flagellar assembly protein FliH
VEHDHHTRPYRFDRIFEANLTEAPNRRDLDLQIMTLQSELAQVRADQDEAAALGRADGFAAGLAQARGETAESVRVAALALVTGLDGLAARFAETEARMAATAADVALVAAELIAADAVAPAPALAVDAAIGRVLAQIGYREGLQVHVHPLLMAPLAALIDERQAAGQRVLALTMHADATLALGDAHIMWDKGGLSLDRAARVAAVAVALGLAL